jgi:transposase
MTIFVGIDVAKAKHDVALIDEAGKKLDAFVIKNNAEGFNLLHSKLKALNSNVKVALESTGHYSHNITRFLESKDYTVWTYNPLIINEFAKSQSLRKTKTDKKDAATIAQRLRLDNPDESIKYDDHAYELKRLTRQHERLVNARSNFKVQLVNILDLAFPELADVVGKKNLHTQSLYELLTKYPSACKIARAHDKSLININYMTADKAMAIKEVAKSSIGVDSEALTFELKQNIEEIIHLTKSIEEVDKEIERITETIDTPIFTIPGVGPLTGSAILGEIGSIDNFENFNQLLAYAGLEPSIYQSGQSDVNGHMVKRGSTHLRRAIVLAAHTAVKYSPTFRKYFEKKMSEGKHYNVSIIHVSKKLLRVIFHLLKNNLPFDESKMVTR